MSPYSPAAYAADLAGRLDATIARVHRQIGPEARATEARATEALLTEARALLGDEEAMLRATAALLEPQDPRLAVACAIRADRLGGEHTLAAARADAQAQRAANARSA